jgi:ATP-binding cassette subfamily B protein
MVGGIVAGGLMVINGSVSIGTFVAYVGMVIGIIWPLTQFGRLIAQVSTTSVSYKRLRSVLNEEREDTESGATRGQPRLSGSIRFENVSFSYDDTTPVLKHVNLTCTPGERIALLGEPGSGKTSLVNLLPRFYPHNGGRLELDGRPIDEFSRRFLRENIGIVEQEPFLFSTDIRNNITYGIKRDATQPEIEEAAIAAAIHESILSFPEGYDTMVGEKGVTLSGGQKQRIAIARTLLKDPAILILDDSTSAVDSETEDLIRGALEELMRDRTTFIIAHRVQSLMNANQILVFKEGEIIQRGTHPELIAKEGFYRSVFEAQTRIETELEEHLTHG